MKRYIERLTKYFKLVRVHLWYRNLLCALPLLMCSPDYSLELIKNVLVSFITLCLASSWGYILNDILDLESDRRNPLKRNRPLPSGEVSIAEALLIWTFLFCSSFSLSTLLLSVYPLLLMANTALYSKYTKHIPFLDITSLSMNYIIRVLEGYRAINVAPNIDLLLTVYFLATLLSLGKRVSELSTVGESYRRGLKGLSTNTALAIASIYGVFFMFYISDIVGLKFITIPLISFLVARYIYLIENNPRALESPYTLLHDKLFSAVLIPTVLLILYSFYGGV